MLQILMTCVNVGMNQPLIELRGKYMLCGSNGPGLNRPPRPAAPPPPGPHIFHYKLSRDNTEVCVDYRTYGNDARFVRRLCQPNAEVFIITMVIYFFFIVKLLNFLYVAELPKQSSQF